MARYIPSPVGATFESWSSVVAESLADLGVVAPAQGVDWKEWAASLLNFPELTAFPDPYGFPSWDDWAVRTLETNIN